MSTVLPIRVRIIVIAAIVTPLLAGAAWCALVPTRSASPRPQVAITIDDYAVGSAADRLVVALMRGTNFSWVKERPDQAARRLSDGRLLAQVAVPARPNFVSGTTANDRIVVTPGRRGFDAMTFAELIRQVSAAASEVWADELAGVLGHARNDVDTAQASATMLAASGAAANDQFSDLFAQVAQMLLQAEPLVQRAQAMLKTMSGINNAMQSIGDSLGRYAASLRGVDLTVGDVQGGLDAAQQDVDLASRTMVETAPLRAQVGPAVAPAIDSLRANGSPDLVRLARELDIVLFLIGGPGEAQARGLLAAGRTSTEDLGGLLSDLSGLLGSPVDASTQVSHVLDLGQNQLRSLQASLADGQRTMKSVADQVLRGEQQLPAMRADVANKLKRFQEITQQLTQSLVTTRQTLTGAAPQTGDTIALSGATSESGWVPEDVVHTVLLVLIGAVGNALGFSFLARRCAWWLALAAAGAIVVGLGAVGTAVLGEGLSTPAFGLLVLAAAAFSALAAAFLRSAGETVGSIALIGVLAVTAWAGGHTDGAGRLLPSSYAIDGLARLTSTDANGAGVLVGAICVMSGLVFASIGSCSFLQWRYGPRRLGHVKPRDTEVTDQRSASVQPGVDAKSAVAERD
jgi:hypothetical protein